MNKRELREERRREFGEGDRGEGGGRGAREVSVSLVVERRDHQTTQS